MSVWIESSVAVAGGTGGIGQAIVKRLYAGGYDVTVLGRDRKKHEKIFGRDKVIFKPLEAYAGSDVFINCIGAPFYSESHEVEEASLDASYISNLKIPALLMARGLEHMRLKKRGWLININSESGLNSNVQGALYAPFKYAARGFMDTARRENRRKGIRVTELYPGMTDTPFMEAMPRKPEKNSLIVPDDIAKAVLFLLDSDVYISEMTLPNMYVNWEKRTDK